MRRIILVASVFLFLGLSALTAQTQKKCTIKYNLFKGDDVIYSPQRDRTNHKLRGYGGDDTFFLYGAEEVECDKGAERVVVTKRAVQYLGGSECLGIWICEGQGVEQLSAIGAHLQSLIPRLWIGLGLFHDGQDLHKTASALTLLPCPVSVR